MSNKKQEYCRSLRWFSGIEGSGDYHCALGNKTSCEWCEENNKRCQYYEPAEKKSKQNKILVVGIPKYEWKKEV